MIKPTKKQKKHPGKKPEADIISDPRFSSIHFDPKFVPVPHKVYKAEIDDRFKGVFTDPKFRQTFQKDKYGRDLMPIGKSDAENLYLHEENDSSKKEKTETKNKIKKNKNNIAVDPRFQQNFDEEVDTLKQTFKKEKNSSNNDKVFKKKKEGKINDPRFQENLFENPKNVQATSKNQSVKNKKGKKLSKSKDERNTSEQLANLEENPNPDGPQKAKKKTAKSNEQIFDKYYSKDGKFEWKGESSQSESSEVQSDLEIDPWQEEDRKNVPLSEDKSKTLALVNYDWSRITAEHLMVLFNSMKPQEGLIKKITVYPSDFGLERMKVENLEGPQEIWKEHNGKEDLAEEAEKIKKEQRKKKKSANHPEKEINEWIAKADDSETDFDPLKLRQYEKDRLKYYYAIVECDSIQTADHIYVHGNDSEFELTGLKLDLRFVTEGTAFPNEPKEICDYIPSSTKIQNFLNRAVNHTNVKLTWEEPNQNRFDYLYEKDYAENDWDKVDFSKVLGDPEENDSLSERSNDDEIDDNDDNNKIEKIETKEDKTNNHDNEEENNGWGGSGDWRGDFDKKNRHKNKLDMEITFSTGFGEQKKKEKEEGDKSLWQKYLEKKKEKKKEKKDLKRKKMNEDDYFIMPNESEEDEEKNLETLELLVDEKKEKKPFEVDVKDERFKAIFEDGKFGIDPTHKDFKVQGSGRFLKEVVEKRKKVKRE